MGLLPLALFANGHAFFVQRHDVRSRVAPLAVHATYTFDGAGAGAKQFRFRERGLWFEDQSFVDNTTKMLTWDAASLPAHARGPVGAQRTSTSGDDSDKGCVLLLMIEVCADY